MSNTIKFTGTEGRARHVAGVREEITGRSPRTASSRSARIGSALGQEDGIATAEFSIVTLAAVGFAGLLVAILGSGEVKGMLLNLVRQAIGG